MSVFGFNPSKATCPRSGPTRGCLLTALWDVDADFLPWVRIAAPVRQHFRVQSRSSLTFLPSFPSTFVVLVQPGPWGIRHCSINFFLPQTAPDSLVHKPDTQSFLKGTVGFVCFLLVSPTRCALFLLPSLLSKASASLIDWCQQLELKLHGLG